MKVSYKSKSSISKAGFFFFKILIILGTNLSLPYRIRSRFDGLLGMKVLVTSLHIRIWDSTPAKF